MYIIIQRKFHSIWPCCYSVWDLSEVVSGMADSKDPPNFFVKHRKIIKLVLTNNLSLIRDELFDCGLIKPDVNEDIKDRNTKIPSSQMADMVIGCLKDKMELNSDHMKTFHMIISSPDRKPHYDDILKLMEEPG